MSENEKTTLKAIWDGIPDNPDKAGWHLVRRQPGQYLRLQDIGVEEVFHYDPRRELMWVRTENGSRHGWTPNEFAWNWEYVGALSLTKRLLS